MNKLFYLNKLTDDVHGFKPKFILTFNYNTLLIANFYLWLICLPFIIRGRP